MANTKTYYDTLASVPSAADRDIIVVQTDSNSNLDTMKKTTIGAIRQPIVDMIAAASFVASSAGSYVAGMEQNASGAVRPIFTGFDTEINGLADNNNAPTSKAVKDYVESEITSTINDNIDAKINDLDISEVGGAGKYISKIKEVDGKIVPTETDFDIAINSYSDNNNAPTSKAVKDHVTDILGTLNLRTVGGEGQVIQSVSQSNGKISATAIPLDSEELSSNASKIPTSKVVYNKINGLNGSVGNSNTLVKSVTETGGVISGETIVIVDTITNSSNAVPHSKAVYEFMNNSINNALSVLDFSSGASNAYIKYVTQEDGKVSVGLQTFDTIITTESATDTNIPTSKAVKAYVDAASGEASSALSVLNYDSGNASSSMDFIVRIKQYEGLVSAEKRSFENAKLYNNASYLKNIDTAPTVRAVTEQIERLDNEDASLSSRINSLNLNKVGTPGTFISEISQASGAVSASTTNFVNTISDTTTKSGNNIAPTEHAVRQAINALNASNAGSDAGYIKYASEASGIISVTPVLFDTYTAASGWTYNYSSNAAYGTPSTEAVENRIEEAKRQILEESKAITYEGKVNSLADLDSDDHKPYDQGDTFIAGAEFSLDGLGDPKYVVHIGSMLIAKASSADFNKDNFDIVSGSEDAIFYASDAESVEGHFAIFSDSTGRALVDSGENTETLNNRVIAASNSASLAGSSADAASNSASLAASYASFAEIEIGPYIASAASEASLAASYASDSSVAASYTIDYKDSASSSADIALQKEDSASSSADIALQKENSASSSADVALQKENSASSSADAALIAASYAIDYKDSASDSADAASGFATSASNSKDSAINFATSASNSATAAASSAQSALTSEINAGSSATVADTKKSCAASSADIAKTKESCSASSADLALQKENEAASSATVAKTKESCSASSADMAKTKESCSASSANAAANLAVLASNSATEANSKAIAASNSASKALTYENNASSSANKALTYEGNASSSATAANTARACSASSATSASYAASAAASYEGAASAAASKIADYEPTASAAASKIADYEPIASEAASKIADYEPIASAAASKIADYEPIASAAASKIADYEPVASAAASKIADYEPVASAAASKIADYEPIASAAASNAASYEGAAEAAACGASSVKSYADLTFIRKVGGDIATPVGLTLSADSFNATSSIKYKENIKPTAVSALELIDAVNIVDFNYKADSEKKPHIGFIAEDTDELLSTPGKDKMDYTNCIGVLMKAVQELKKGMASLAEKIE